jgi:hypothetical protein
MDENTSAAQTTDAVDQAVATSDVPEEAAGRKRPRSVLVHFIIVMSAVIMLVTAVQVWVDRAVLDTDNWVEASDDLLADPQIRSALSVYVVDQLYANVDVSGELGDLLPGDLSGLAGPLAAALRNPATEAVDRLLATPQVAAIWSEANARAHQTIVNILKDETNPAFSTTDGTVTLNVREVVIQLAQSLGFSGDRLQQIPEDAGQITVAESSTLENLQQAVTIVEWASWLLFILVIALFALAIYLADGWRRVATRNVGFAVIIVGLLIVAGLRVGGSVLIDAIVKNEVNRPVADSVWRIGSELLRDLGQNLVAIGLVIVIGAIIAGPTRAARAIRRFLSPIFVGSPAVRWGVGAAVWLLLVIWSPLPALSTWWGVLALAGIVAFCVEGLHRLCTADRAAAGDEIDTAVAEPDVPAPIAS